VRAYLLLLLELLPGDGVRLVKVRVVKAGQARRATCHSGELKKSQTQRNEEKKREAKGAERTTSSEMKQITPRETHRGGRTRARRGCTGHPNRQGQEEQGGVRVTAKMAALFRSVAGYGEDRDAGRGKDGDGIAIPAAASSTAACI